MSKQKQRDFDQLDMFGGVVIPQAKIRITNPYERIAFETNWCNIYLFMSKDFRDITLKSLVFHIKSINNIPIEKLTCSAIVDEINDPDRMKSIFLTRTRNSFDIDIKYIVASNIVNFHNFLQF